MALKASTGTLKARPALPEWFTRQVDWYRSDAYHLTVRGGPAHEAWGTFTEGQLAYAGDLKRRVHFDKLVVLWGSLTGVFFLALAPSDESLAELAEDWGAMGQTSTSFRVHLSLGEFSRKLGEELDPDFCIPDEGYADTSTLTEVLGDELLKPFHRRMRFDRPHLGLFDPGVTITEQTNYFPKFRNKGWTVVKGHFPLVPSSR